MEFIKTLLKGLLQTVLRIIFGSDWKKFGDALKAAVFALIDNEDMTGEEKKKEVYRQAREVLKEIGVEVKSSMLNLLIEWSYQLLKK